MCSSIRLCHYLHNLYHSCDILPVMCSRRHETQVEVLKQELAMVSVRQLAMTGIPTGDALLRSVREGAGPGPGGGSGSQDLPASHDIPPAPDGDSSNSTGSEGIAAIGDEDGRLGATYVDPARDGGLLDESRRHEAPTAPTAPRGEAQHERPLSPSSPSSSLSSSWHRDTNRRPEKRVTSAEGSQEWSDHRVRRGWETTGESEDEATVRMGNPDSTESRPRGNRRQGEHEYRPGLHGKAPDSGSEREDGVGWWTQSADELLLSAEGETSRNGVEDGHRNADGGFSSGGRLEGRGEGRRRASDRRPSGGIGDTNEGVYARQPSHQGVASASLNREAVVVRRPRTWFEEGEGARLLSSSGANANGPPVVTSQPPPPQHGVLFDEPRRRQTGLSRSHHEDAAWATTGSSRRRQHGQGHAALGEPPPDGADGDRELHTKPRPMAYAESKKMRGVRVSWDSTVSSMGSGPSTHLHADPGTTDYAGRRRRVPTDDGAVFKSGSGNDSVVPRARRVRDGARVPSLAQDGLRRPTTSASVAPAADEDISPRTRYATDNARSRVRRRPWGNTGQSVATQGQPNRRLDPPQQHQSPTSDPHSRDQRMGTNGGTIQGQRDNGNAAKPSRRAAPPRKSGGVVSMLGESRAVARELRNAGTERERLTDVHGVGGAGGGHGGRRRAPRGEWGIDRRGDDGDVWAERQKTRWDVHMEGREMSPSPLDGDEKVKPVQFMGTPTAVEADRRMDGFGKHSIDTLYSSLLAMLFLCDALSGLP